MSKNLTAEELKDLEEVSKFLSDQDECLHNLMIFQTNDIWLLETIYEYMQDSTGSLVKPELIEKYKNALYYKGFMNDDTMTELIHAMDMICNRIFGNINKPCTHHNITMISEILYKYTRGEYIEIEYLTAIACNTELYIYKSTDFGWEQSDIYDVRDKSIHLIK